MPKKTKNKAPELVKPGKNSSVAEKNAYDIVDSVNKIKNTGKSSRTGKKANSNYYDEIIQHSDILFSLLKEEVNLNEVVRKATQIKGEANLIYNTCGEYLLKNRGIRWSTKGRERVRQVKRLRNAIWLGIITETQPDHAYGMFDNKKTYGQLYAMSSYLPTASNEEKIEENSISKASDKEVVKSNEEFDLFNSNFFDGKKPDFDSIVDFFNKCNIDGLKYDSAIRVDIQWLVSAMEDNDMEEAGNRFGDMYTVAQQYGEAAEKAIEVLWEGYRPEMVKNNESLPSDFKEYIKPYI